MTQRILFLLAFLTFSMAASAQQINSGGSSNTFGPNTPNGHTLGGNEVFPIMSGSSAYNNATAQDIANFAITTGISNQAIAPASVTTPAVTTTGTGNSAIGSALTNYDYSKNSSDTRYFYLNNSLAPSTSTSNIWEQMNSFLTLSSGTTTGEINLIHSYLQTNAGSSAVGSENFEASSLINGTITALDGYEAIMHNGSTGTVTGFGLTGFYASMVNDNTTSNSVSQWVGFACFAPTGSGSAPTNDYCLYNSDPNGQIGSIGRARFGNLANGTGAFNSTGPDSSHYNYNSTWYNSTNSLTDWVSDDGSVAIANAASIANFHSTLLISDLGGNATYGTHIAVVQTTAPTITAGTATLDTNASDVWGTVTEGTSQTGFTLTFAVAWNTAPHCTVTSPTGNTYTSYTPSTTTLVVANASQTSSKYTYMCGQ